MDSQIYFEIVHYLKSGLYPRNSTWIYRKELRNRCKNYYLSKGVLLRVGSGLTVLHRCNAKNKLTELRRKNDHPSRENLESMARQTFSVRDLRKWCRKIVKECLDCDSETLFRCTRGPMKLLSEVELNRVCRELGLEQGQRHCYELFER